MAVALPLRTDASPAVAPPVDLVDDTAYRRWREWKLSQRPTQADDVTVPLADPRALTRAELAALRSTIARASFALYRSPVRDADPALPRRLGAQLGLQRLDANWLADEDGISRIEVSDRGDSPGDKAGYIPYTTHGIRWHTDGYYHPEARRLHGMILHAVRPAAAGGINRVVDHELAVIALRDESPRLVAALMRRDAMTIPARLDASGAVARAAQTGPVLTLDDGRLHLRYTARTRSIEWCDDADVRAATTFLAAWLDSSPPGMLTVRLEPGMGLVGRNVLHDRSVFVDDPARPRLLYRARYLDAPSVHD